MKEEESYRQILRSSSIIGGSAVINIVLGLVRTKVAALLLGPSGIGLIGLLSSLASTASVIAGFGIGSVGTRHIAEAKGLNDVVAVATARRMLFSATFVLAVIGSAVFWSLREVLATNVLRTPALAPEVGWLALFVGLTVIASAQVALLNGLRRIGDLARINVLSGLLSTALGVGALIIWGKDGITAYLIVIPLSSLILGYLYVLKLPKVIAPSTTLSASINQWKGLARLGGAFMLASLAGLLGQLFVRMLVQSELGFDALGYFQAASAISVIYVGFVLTAMGTDYYPRLTIAIRDREEVNRMVNEQTEIALLLAAPAFLAMIGLAPWIIELLYSPSFHPAADVLRWQVLGDILKIISWPLAFVIAAAGAGRTFLITECLGSGVFVLVTWIALPLMGITATGLSFVAMYLIYLLVVYWIVRRKNVFQWTYGVKMQIMCIFAAALSLFAISNISSFWGGVTAIGLSIVFGLYSVGHLANKTNLSGPLGNLSIAAKRYLLRITGKNQK